MEIIRINNKNYREAVEKAADFIKQGKVVVFPTDTVYGLIGDVTNKKAVDKIFAIKKRNKQKYFPIFVKDIKIAKIIAKIDKRQEDLLKKYWPGEITVVLTRKPGRTLYGVDKKTIAIRMPKYKFLNILLKKLEFPLVQTSANISGLVPIATAEEVSKQFRKNKPDLIIDGGELKNKQSRLIDLTVNPYKVLRQ